MHGVVDEILDNTYEYEKGFMDFSCKKIEIELQKGEIYEGSFSVHASEGKYTKGYVTASDPRMECLSDRIHGDREVIGYRFHGEWMDVGEVTRGEFRIVSNKGEYYLPYVVSVRKSQMHSSIGPIKNLLQFTSLAKCNWEEALQMFYSPAFGEMIKETEPALYLKYLGLTTGEKNEQHMDTFLVAAYKKQKVEYTVSEKKLFLSDLAAITEQPINIFRNGWGYTRLEVICEGEALFVEKNVITEDDFLGNRFTLPVYVDSSLLHQGYNFCNVMLKSADTKIEIPVLILKKQNKEADNGKNIEKKNNLIKLMRAFEKYRLKDIPKNDWIMETTRIIDRMVTLDEKDIATRLFQAHLLITKEQYNEAGWILEHASDLIEGDIAPSLEAYYLYLNTLFKKEEGYTGEIGWQVTRIYREHGEEWQVAWLLLFLIEEYKRNPVSRWNLLLKQFESGCTSPLIYLEALILANSNPTLMRNLGAFEIQVLNYGRKKGHIQPELIEQVLYLSERTKRFDKLLYDFYAQMYNTKKDQRILKEICTLLIKGNKTDRDAFSWFEKGVEEELRITNLYEFFMLSMDLEQEPEIPKQVLLYYTYQTGPDYLRNGYLYYYLTKRSRVYRDIYNNYYPKIAMFVQEQIGKERINKHLAYLYQTFLDEESIDEAMSASIAKLIFAREIRIEDKEIRRVIVLQPEYTEPTVYPVSGSSIWIPVYHENSCILTEGSNGERFVYDTKAGTESVWSAQGFVDKVASFVKDSPKFDIYMYYRNLNKIMVKDEDVERWQRMTRYVGLSDSLKAQLQLQLVHYYYEKEKKEQLKDFLIQAEGDFMMMSQRGEIIRYMVLCDCMDAAYEWLTRYGTCKTENQILLQLLEDKVRKESHVKDETLLYYCYEMVKKGCYSQELLQYLMEYYQGLTRDLRNIWKASKDYTMNRRTFDEQILLQMLFSGYYVGEQADIFKEYMLENNNGRIVDAYLTKHCYEYFVKDALIQKSVLVEISRSHSLNHPVTEMCKLAFLKYYAENKEEIINDDIFVIRDFVDYMMQKGIRMNCILELLQYSSRSKEMPEKTIVECHADLNVRPIIHYVIMRENGEVGEYVQEPMEHVLGGVFTKEFILFFGETLQYYIVEEREGRGKLTQSGTKQKEELMGEELPGRYGMINDIVISKTLQDYDTFDDLLEEYYKKDFYNQELFKLKE